MEKNNDEKGMTEPEADCVQYLTFMSGNELYGISVSSVREVIEYNRIYKIPRVPDFFRGVTNLRGEVVPVVDLSARLYDRLSSVTILTSIVIIEIKSDNKTIMVGLIVDEIKSVNDISDRDIENAPDIGARIRSDFIKGIGRIDDNFIILLDIFRVLDVDELADAGGLEKAI